MSKKQPTWLDGILGSQLRDTQGEMLDVAGADISELEAGRGRWNDNHGVGYFNSLGRITYAKKIFKAEDCDDDRQKYYWEKIKAPYIYGKGYLYDDEDHPNARAAAAILRSIHKHDAPLKLKLSVEGGVMARGVKDSTLLARTKIHSCAVTFTPANNATLVEPLGLEKTSQDYEADLVLIKSVMHLARTNVPSFRHITRMASAEKIADNFRKTNEMARLMGLTTVVPEFTPEELVKQAAEHKIVQNINKINELIKGSRQCKLKYDSNSISEPILKALTAGYGGAGAPTSRTGGGVLQTEHIDVGRGFKYIRCNECGHEQIYMKHQVRCREPNCGKSFPMADLYPLLVRDN